MKRNKRTTDIDKDELSDLFIESSSASQELRRRGIYYITGMIESGDLVDIQQDMLLKHLTGWNGGDIQIVINSCGGDSTEGWGLIDMMNWVRMDIRTLVLGEASSLGSMILASGTPGKRAAAPNATIMIHAPWITHMAGSKPELVAQMKDVVQEHERSEKLWLHCSKYTTAAQVRKHLLIVTGKHSLK